jgi:hypothetical protein
MCKKKGSQLISFYRVLFDCLIATGLFSFSNVLDLIDICSL